MSFDAKTGSNLLQWPVNELEKLRTSCEEFKNIKLHAGSVIPLEVAGSTQVCIFLPFLFKASFVSSVGISKNCGKLIFSA